MQSQGLALDGSKDGSFLVTGRWAYGINSTGLADFGVVAGGGGY